MIVVEDMELKDVAALKEKIEAVDHVKKVLWYDSVLDLSVPVEMQYTSTTPLQYRKRSLDEIENTDK